MRARIEARSFTPLCQPPNKQLQRTVTRNRGRAAASAFYIWVGSVSQQESNNFDMAFEGRPISLTQACSGAREPMFVGDSNTRRAPADA